MNQVPQVVTVLLEKTQRESKRGLKSVKIGIPNNSTKYSVIALKYFDGTTTTGSMLNKQFLKRDFICIDDWFQEFENVWKFKFKKQN